MGLSQKIKFNYSDRFEVEEFIRNVFQCQKVTVEKELFVITPKDNDDFLIELAIEDYGLYIHRSGKYFEMLGILVEQLTGKFSETTIEDY